MKILQNISDRMNILDRHPRRCMWSVTAFAVIYYLLVSLQGIDFADEGFSLTFYQNIYTHPADVEYLFLYYLTGLIGGAWELLMGWLGTYGYRILFALTSGGIVLTTFAILKPYFRTSTIVIGTLASILWPGLCLYYFNHDCLTILLFLLTIYAMMQGLQEKKAAWYVMGFILIINSFTRLPNIALCLLILVPLIEANQSGNYYKAGQNIMRIIAGMIIGSLLMLLIMYLLQHLDLWLSSVVSLLVMGGDSSDTHGIKNLIGSYSYTYKAIFTSTLYGVLVCFTYIIATEHIKIKGNKLIVGIICIALFYMLLERNIYAMWGAVTSAAIIYAFINRKDGNNLILALSALVALIVIPLGGDSYANICNSCMWLGMPMLIDLIRRPIKCNINIDDYHNCNYRFTIDNTVSRDIHIITATAFILYVATHSVCYFDNGSRMLKTHRPQIATVATTYTSQERARLIDQITTVTLKHRMPGNYLLVFDNAPMLHYLTGMQPYLGSPWSTFWGTEMFKQQLFNAEHSSRQLPLIAIPRFFYQDLSKTDYLNAIEHPELHKKALLLADFIERNGYYEVYRDEYIILLKVPQ
ncbi:MAG: hypothetical protein IJN35_02350 [Muribaculaceae bacterium]|nr:hypothetical protein [Muribaculaceae bacterium]